MFSLLVSIGSVPVHQFSLTSQNCQGRLIGYAKLSLSVNECVNVLVHVFLKWTAISSMHCHLTIGVSEGIFVSSLTLTVIQQLLD